VTIRGRLASLLALLMGALLGTGVTPVRAGEPPLPNSMAAIGDSITQAADVCCWYGDHPGKSWSVGGDADSISSHYERILAMNPGIAGSAFMDAVSGAKMDDAAAQAVLAVSQQPGYVTILMGANDACTPPRP
jgi:lysophospholipase L1-like esterase